jgi:DNA-binding NarL/FixJ family response regulator
MRQIRAVIADDSPRSLEALRVLLASWPACEVVGEAATGRAALAQIVNQRPDLAILDVQMPSINGLMATRLIKSSWPNVKVILLSIDEQYRKEAEAAGADAFMAKTEAAERLLSMLSTLFLLG